MQKVVATLVVQNLGVFSGQFGRSSGWVSRFRERILAVVRRSNVVFAAMLVAVVVSYSSLEASS